MESSLIIGIRIIGEVRLGDVVVFEHEGRLLVKRIAALLGDAVVIGSEQTTILGSRYFMFGDNGDASIDSRSWDEPLIEISRIVD